MSIYSVRVREKNDAVGSIGDFSDLEVAYAEALEYSRTRRTGPDDRPSDQWWEITTETGATVLRAAQPKLHGSVVSV